MSFEELYCPDTLIANAKPLKKTKNGQSNAIVCKDGFELEAGKSSTVKCDNGKWSPSPLPACVGKYFSITIPYCNTAPVNHKYYHCYNKLLL